MDDKAKIRKVAIVGAGAMGAAYAAMFSEAEGFNVSFVARGERYQKLSRASLNVNGKHYVIPVLHPDKVAESADLIIVALKHHHLSGALDDINSFVGEDTVLLSVMNGLESEEMIGAVCGADRVVYAIAVGIDAVYERDRYTYASPGRIVFGEGRHRIDPKSIERLREALTRAGIPNEVPADMLRAMWWKFMINVGINQASAVLRAPYGVFQSSPDARALMEMLMREVIEMARAIKVDLAHRDLDEWVDLLSKLSPNGKTSMLQDIEAGRKTEVEIFAGKMVALGDEQGVPTPVNAAVLHMIKVLENQ